MSGDRQTCRINFLGRQPNKRIWQTLPVRTQNLANLADINSNLANLADMNSKLGESCRYELKLGESCRYEHKNGDLAGVNNNG